MINSPIHLHRLAIGDYSETFKEHQSLDLTILHKIHPDDSKDEVFNAIVKALIVMDNKPSSPKELASCIIDNDFAILSDSSPYATVSSRISQHFKRISECYPPRLAVLSKTVDRHRSRRILYYISLDFLQSSNILQLDPSTTSFCSKKRKSSHSCTPHQRVKIPKIHIIKKGRSTICKIYSPLNVEDHLDHPNSSLSDACDEKVNFVDRESNCSSESKEDGSSEEKDFHEEMMHDDFIDDLSPLMLSKSIDVQDPPDMRLDPSDDFSEDGIVPSLDERNIICCSRKNSLSVYSLDSCLLTQNQMIFIAPDSDSAPMIDLGSRFSPNITLSVSEARDLEQLSLSDLDQIWPSNSSHCPKYATSPKTLEEHPSFVTSNQTIPTPLPNSSEIFSDLKYPNALLPFSCSIESKEPTFPKAILPKLTSETSNDTCLLQEDDLLDFSDSTFSDSCSSCGETSTSVSDSSESDIDANPFIRRVCLGIPIILTIIDCLPLYAMNIHSNNRCFKLLRRVDNGYVNATVLLTAGGFETEAERSIVLSLELSRSKIRKGHSSLHGTWIPLSRARALAATCSLHHRLGPFLNDNLRTLFPSILPQSFSSVLSQAALARHSSLPDFRTIPLLSPTNKKNEYTFVQPKVIQKLPRPKNPKTSLKPIPLIHTASTPTYIETESEPETGSKAYHRSNSIQKRFAINWDEASDSSFSVEAEESEIDIGGSDFDDDLR